MKKKDHIKKLNKKLGLLQTQLTTLTTVIRKLTEQMDCFNTQLKQLKQDDNKN